MKRYQSFLLAAFILAVNGQLVFAAGPTSVTDNIAASTEWTKDNSPYVIQKDIIVSRGAVLTIDPGVEVQFVVSPGAKVGSSPNLVIEGGLKAVGNSAAPVAFNPAATGSLWGALYFYNADSANCLLQGCLIKGGRVVCNSASPTITQCAIYGAKTGVEIYANSQPQIINNKITANGYGISLRDDTASPVVSSNEVYNNNVGFYFEKFGTPSITGNKIYNNLKYNMINYSVKSIDAPNNDFRMVNPQLIARTIYDGNWNASLGRVNLGLAAGVGQPAMAAAPNTASQEKPKIQEEDFWSYGRPFDAMKITNVDDPKKKSSNTVKVLAVGATAVVTAVLLFL